MSEVRRWNFTGHRGGPTRVLSAASEPGPHVCEACSVRAACIDTRPQINYVRRRFKCLRCAGRWTTYEVRKDRVTETMEATEHG